jgi:hypothetical protein
MDTLTTIKLDGSCTMHEPIIEMKIVTTRLKHMGYMWMRIFLYNLSLVHYL